MSFIRMSQGIQANHIYKSFHGQVVLQDLCLSVASQDSVAIMGQSGTGKSVFLRCLLGLCTRNQGTITIGPYPIGSESCKEQEQRFRQSGVVFQSYALFDSLLIWENVSFALKGSPRMRKEKAILLLEKVELPPRIADLYPSELSGGMKRRVSIARAIALSPTYLFFDEPTEGLDPILAYTISQLIRNVIVQLKATAVTITHNLTDACTIGDRIALLDQGKIVWQGKEEEMKNSTIPIVQQFVKGHHPL